jgi:hypothetical protein
MAGIPGGYTVIALANYDPPAATDIGDLHAGADDYIISPLAPISTVLTAPSMPIS